jgi:site-specific DNA recombinase
MTRAAIYLRLSKKDDNGNGESLAIDRQRKACRHLCEARGWEIVTPEYVDDGTSASKSRAAAEFGKMITDAEAGKFDVVVAYAADRIARRLSDIETLINTGVKAATVQGDLDLTTPEGEGQASILVTFARMEARQKSVRQKAAALQAAENGVPHMSRIRAFGYEADGMTIREDEAEALRAAYASILAGATLVSLCRDLTAAGFLTPAGKPWRHSGIRAIMLNARNCGLRTYSETKNGRMIKGKERMIIGPANWPAIVDRETFKAVKSILENSGRRKNGNTGTARRWLLGGLAVCGHPDESGEICDAYMRVNYRGDHDRDGNAVRVYKCREGNHLSRTAKWVDWRVTEHIITKLSQPDARDLLVDDQREDINDLRRERDLINTRLKQYAADAGRGDITRDEWRAAREPMLKRIKDLDDRMEHVDRAPVLADLVNADDVRARWETIGLDRQRTVINLLYKVILLPRPPGRYETRLESVIMEPKL